MALYLCDVRDWLKTLDLPIENYYIGKLDAKKDKSLGVYHLKASRTSRYVIGGKRNSTFGTKQVSVLVHYTKNQKETEIAAYRIYDTLKAQRPVKIGDTSINFISMVTDEPVDVAMDEQNIYEYVIEFEINYKKKQEE